MSDFIRLLAVSLAVALAVAVVSVSAHEVTYNGVVVALKTTKYAQPSGGTREARELEVTIVDAKTKKPSNRVFTVTNETKVLRAGKSVPVANMTATQGEKVAVVIDHDEPGDEAIEVRFAAAV